MAKGGIVCPTPFSILEFGLAWACTNSVHAFTTTPSSYVQLPCCVRKISPCGCLLRLAFAVLFTAIFWRSLRLRKGNVVYMFTLRLNNLQSLILSTIVNLVERDVEQQEFASSEGVKNSVNTLLNSLAVSYKITWPSNPASCYLSRYDKVLYVSICNIHTQTKQKMASGCLQRIFFSNWTYKVWYPGEEKVQ